MMKITVNGEAREFAQTLSAAQLIESLGLGGRRCALEVNLEIVPRSAYATHQFKDGDRVEIVQAIGGG